MSLPRVLVIAGGLSGEREVSLSSGSRVAGALRDAGHEVEVVDFDAGLTERLHRSSGDVVVPLLHGAEGEDGSLPTLLAAVGIPFVGSPAAGCRLAFDKPTANTLLGRAGVRVPRGVVLPQRAFRELGARPLLDIVESQLGYPLVVKPVRGGSSLGVGFADDATALATAVAAAFSYGEAVLVGDLIRGVEIAVSVVDTGTGPIALPAVEIKPDDGRYDYRSRYTAGLTEFFTPARIAQDQARAAAEVALTAHDQLGLRDWSRTDMVVDEHGQICFLETNSVPGMTPTSLFPMAVGASELALPDLYSAVVRAAAKR